MHRMVAVIIIAVLTQQMFLNTFVVIDFIINQDFIALNLCVQKDNQQGCNGKCQLTKTLKENNQENSDTSQQNTLRFENELKYYIQEVEFEKSICHFENKLRLTEQVLVKTVLPFYEVLTPPPEFI